MVEDQFVEDVIDHSQVLSVGQTSVCRRLRTSVQLNRYLHKRQLQSLSLSDSGQRKTFAKRLDNLVGRHASRTFNQDQIAFPNFLNNASRGFVRTFEERRFCSPASFAPATISAPNPRTPQRHQPRLGLSRAGFAMKRRLVGPSSNISPAITMRRFTFVSASAIVRTMFSNERGFEL